MRKVFFVPAVFLLLVMMGKIILFKDINIVNTEFYACNEGEEIVSTEFSAYNEGEDIGDPDSGEEEPEDEEPSEQEILEGITENLEPFLVPFVSLSTDTAEFKNDKKKLSVSSSDYTPYEIKMKKKGALNFSLQMVSPLKKREKLTLIIYKNKDFSSPVLYKKLEKNGDKIEFVSFLNKGIYDFIFSVEGGNNVYANMTFFAYNLSDFSAKNQNENYIGYGNNEKIYVKVNAKKAGIISFSTAVRLMDGENENSLTGIRYEFTDSGKKIISGGITEKDKAYNVSYAVDKGTYYVGITPTAGIYKFSYNISEYPGSKKTSRDEARKVKMDKACYLIIPVGSTKNTQYWFTFNIKKPQNAAIKMKFEGNEGSVKAVVYRENEILKMGNSSLIELVDNKLLSFRWKNEEGQYDKIPAGRYYIRVEKDSDMTNGLFKLIIE